MERGGGRGSRKAGQRYRDVVSMCSGTWPMRGRCDVASRLRPVSPLPSGVGTRQSKYHRSGRFLGKINSVMRQTCRLDRQRDEALGARQDGLAVMRLSALSMTCIHLSFAGRHREASCIQQVVKKMKAFRTHALEGRGTNSETGFESTDVKEMRITFPSQAFQVRGPTKACEHTPPSRSGSASHS